MSPSELYKLWGPDNSAWSDWAKPVLFADSSNLATFQPVVLQSLDVSWAPSSESNTAIVLDVEGAQAVWTGVALAARGYRPVPLFNGASGPSAVVDAGRIAGALHAAADDLATQSIPPQAPPVFLLDANRSGGSTIISPGRFDNRWVVFPQDFPSAIFLQSHAIRDVLLVQARLGPPQTDLAHVLLRWQEAGMKMWLCNILNGTKTIPLQVQRPSNFRNLLYRAMALAGLRRNSAGGFGAVVPQPSQSSGFG